MIRTQFRPHTNALKWLVKRENIGVVGNVAQNIFISPKVDCIRGLHSGHIRLARHAANTRKAPLLSDTVISGWIRRIDESKTFESKLEIVQQLHNFRTEDGRQMVSDERVTTAIKESIGTKRLTMESAVSYLHALGHAGASLENQSSLILPSLEIIASQPKKLLDPTILPGFLQTLLKLNVDVNIMAALHTKVLKMVENALTVGIAEPDEVALIFNAFAVGVKPSSPAKVISWLEKVSDHDGYRDLKPDLNGIVRFLAGVSSSEVVSKYEIMAHAQRMLASMMERSLSQTVQVARLEKAAALQVLSLLESLVSLQISFSRDKKARLGTMISNAMDAFLPIVNKLQLPTIFQAMHRLDISWQKIPSSGKSAVTSKLLELSWESDSSVLTESLLSFCNLGPRWINLENQLFQKHILNIITLASLAVEEEEVDDEQDIFDQTNDDSKPFYTPEEDTEFIDEDEEEEDLIPLEPLGSQQQIDMHQSFSFVKVMGSLRIPFTVLNELQQNHLLFSAHYCAEYVDVNELGDLLQAFGQMGVSLHELRLVESDIIKEVFKATKRSKAFTGPGLCSLFNGLQYARYNWQHLSEDETQILLDAIAKFQSSKTYVDYYPLVIHSFSGLGLFWSSFPPTTRRDILRMISEISIFGWHGFGLSKVVFALGKMKLRWQDMPPLLQDILLDALNSDSIVLEDPHSFYLTVQGLANMKVLWSPVFYQPLQEQFVGIKHFSPFELSLCLVSLAHVQASWDTFSDPFKASLTQHMQTLLPELRNDKSVGSILYSIAMLAFDTNVESDRALLQILVEIKKRLEDDWGPKRFKDSTLRREAQVFFEFLATFPFGQNMIADIYGKRLEENFIPTFFNENEVVLKREKQNQVQHDEIYDYIMEVMTPYELKVQRDVNLFRGVFIADFVILNPNKDNDIVAFIDADYLPRSSLGRKRNFKDHLFNFHFPGKPTCLVNLRAFWSWQQQLDELVTQICLQNNFRRQGSPMAPARLSEGSQKKVDIEFDDDDY